MGDNYKKQPRFAKKQFVIIDKSVVGGYFNIARVNFYKTIVHIFASVGIKGTYGEEKIGLVLDALYKNMAGKATELTKEQSEWSRNLKLKNDQMVKMQKLLFKHFPILGPIMADVASFNVYKNKKSNVVNDEELMRGVNLVDCIQVISTMAVCLSECRNFYTHYNPYNPAEDLLAQYKRQEKVARWLDKVFVASRRLDKKRNNITTSEMEFLTGIDHYFQQKKIDEDGNVVPVKDKDGQIKTNRYGRVMYEMQFVEHDTYYFKIIGERTIPVGDAEPKVTRFALSDFGIIYFCSIFLSKTYTKLLVEQTNLFENSPFEGFENDIVREMLCIYRMRTPKGKQLNSKDDTTTLAMDMLNELRKCPMELYDVLSREGQQFFEDKVVHENDHTPDVSKRLRATDRFPYLVMRYIDIKELFKRIRFQVKLGNYRFNFYNKICVDGSVEVRSLQKEINGYGRLQEVEKMRVEKYGDMLQQSEEVPTKLEHEDLHLDLKQFVEDTTESSPYITDYKASYVIHSNRVGLFWEDSQIPKEQKYFMGKSMYLPDLKVKEEGKASVTMPAPKAMLSVFDMPAMMFYQYLLENTSLSGNEFPKTEEIIIKKYDSLKSFFKNVSEGIIKPYEDKEAFCRALTELCLDINEVPKELVDYLSSKQNDESSQERLARLAELQIKQRLERMIRRRDHYEEDRKMVGNKDNKYGKDSYVDVRHGKLAQFLAESLVNWLSHDAEGRSKLTGLNYSKMQAFLATYGVMTSLPEMIDMLKSAKLIECDNPHPFMQNVLDKNPQNIETLYLAYINAEIEFLESFFDKNEKGDITGIKKPIDYARLPFIHHERKRWSARSDDFYKQLAARYLIVKDEKMNIEKEASIWLPDGLFTPYIYRLLRKAYADNKDLMKKIGGEPDEYNASHLIHIFFETVLGDQSQPFYISYSNDKATGKEVTNKFSRNYNLFNILNNNKVGNALKPVYLSTNQINNRLTKKSIDVSGNPVPILDKDGNPMKDENGKPLYLKKIEKEINKFVAGMQKRDRGNHKTLWEAKDAMRVKLHHCIRDIKNNERAIRRYRTQDMILFLLAKKMLSDIISSQNRHSDDNLFMLSKVCSDGFLSQTLRFEYPVKVDNHEIKVVQENMSLKNYGEFYRFINDDRLITLLKQLNEVDEVGHSELLGEFAIYDQRRAEVFSAMQTLEKLAFEAFEPDLTNPQSDNFRYNDVPRRNNFRSLISLFSSIQGDHLDDVACNRLIEIRNAFCHNTFNIGLDKVSKELPNITNHIIGEIDRMLKEAKIR